MIQRTPRLVGTIRVAMRVATGPFVAPGRGEARIHRAVPAGRVGVFPRTRSPPLAPFAALCGRLLSGIADGGHDGAGAGGSKKSGMVDVQGGKVEDENRVEGHLVWAERAKNIVTAHRRFQLTTYKRLPDDNKDQESIHTDTTKNPVTGYLHKEKNTLAILLRNDLPSHQQHKDNVSRMATSSVAIGHLDPVQLVPVFTRVGLRPPVVRMIGDLVPIEPRYEDELRAALAVGPEDGSLYWLEPGGIFFEDMFSERTQVLGCCPWCFCMCAYVCACVCVSVYACMRACVHACVVCVSVCACLRACVSAWCL